MDSLQAFEGEGRGGGGDLWFCGSQDHQAVGIY